MWNWLFFCPFCSSLLLHGDVWHPGQNCFVRELQGQVGQVCQLITYQGIDTDVHKKLKRTRGAHETHGAGENYRKQMEKLGKARQWL